MSKSGGDRSIQVGFSGLLFLLFLTLKLLGLSIVASWSWWWVTAPLWGPVAFALFIFIIIFAFAIVKAV